MESGSAKPMNNIVVMVDVKRVEAGKIVMASIMRCKTLLMVQ